MKNAQNGECRLTPCVQEAIEWAQQEAGYCVELAGLLSPLRTQKYVRIRRLASWRLRTNNRLSLPRIAAILRRDHATIMHLIETENLSRDLPKNYPLNEWREKEALTIEANIDLMDTQLRAGQNLYDVAYSWGVSAEKLKQAINTFRVPSGDKSHIPHADQNGSGRISPALEGVGM